MEPTNRNMNSLSLDITPEFDDVGPSQRTMSALVKVIAKQQTSQELRIPIEISAVIDRSGSMQGAKLQMVKKTLEFFTTQLTVRDKLGIVAYDDRISVPFKMAEMNSEAKARAKTAISQINCGGSTDLCEGLLCGIRQVANVPIPNADSSMYRPPVQVIQRSPMSRSQIQQMPIQQMPIQQMPIQQMPIQQMPIQQMPIQQIPIQVTPIQQIPVQPAQPLEAIVESEQKIAQVESDEKPTQKISTGTVSRSVLLFTDGQANCGITRAPEIIAAMKALLGEVGGRINVFTFGFGDDHDANLLGAISQEANGTYYYINSEDKIRESFADCLGGLLSIAAQNIVLEIQTLPDEAEYVSVETSFNTSPLAGNVQGIKVVIPDLYDEEVRDVLVTFRTKSKSENFGDRYPYLQATVTYMDIALQQERTVDVIGTILRVETGAQVAPNAQVDCCRNRWSAVRAIEEARKRAERGQLTEAKAFLEETIKRIRDSVSFADPVSQAALEDLQRCRDGMRTQDEYTRHGDKFSRMAQHTMTYQRSSAPMSASSEVYVTRRKQMMMRMAQEATPKEEEEN